MTYLIRATIRRLWLGASCFAIQPENNRPGKARKLLLDDAIDAGDFKAIKQECQNRITILESKLTGHSQPAFDLEECATKAPHSLEHLSETYVHGDTGVKRSIISSIYPEKLYMKIRVIEPEESIKQLS